MLVQVLVSGCDHIFFKVGTLQWVARLPHVKLAICLSLAQACRVHLREDALLMRG